MRVTPLTCLLFVIFAGCGVGEDEPSPEPATALEEPPEPSREAAPREPEVETAYAIHEWGFIAHHYDEAEDALISSGAVPAPVYRRPINLDPHPTGRGGGKPVIYVHLQGEGNVARFNASLSTAGRFLEEWPHSEGSTPTRLTWDVAARRGSCSADARYPVANDEHCAGIADGYCEAAELAHYETEDSACLTVAGDQWNHLFYRAQIPGDVPLRVSKSGETFTVHNSAQLPGRLMRIHREDDAVNSRVVLFDAPAAGESMVVPAADSPAPLGVAALEAELSALGMSADETEAFMIAWEAELFGDTSQRTQVEMIGSPPHDLRPKADSLLYFLPVVTLDAMVPLAFTPPPAEVRRAVLVRIDLGEARVPSHGSTISAGTIGLGNHSGYGNGARNRVVVRMGPVRVEGEFSQEIVRRTIRRRNGELRVCGEEHLSAGSEAEVTLQFTITPEGAVQGITTAGGSAALRACFTSNIEAWTFPYPDMRRLQVSTSFNLTASE
ncbi:MAG: AgmX/PglI C-terminal domain-containing protein [Polyangiales bacterium]